MKRLSLLALVLAAGAIAVTAEAKKVKKQPRQKEAPVALVTPSDSLSYAAGVNSTEGLMAFITGQLKVDTAYMADFLQGVRDAVSTKDDPKQTAYRAGQNIADQLLSRLLPNMRRDFTDTPDSISETVFMQGFMHAIQGDTTHFRNTHDATTFFQKKQQENKAARDEKLYGENRRAGEQFLADNAKKQDVHVTSSGLQYKVLTQGTGATPKATDRVQVNYEGRLIDGKVFDSSYKRGKPSTFEANRVIKGWTEALTMMPVGSKWQLFIPYNLAYGERDMGDIKPYSTLIFEVELLDIEEKK